MKHSANMDYSNMWRYICDGVWICTTTKYVKDPNRVPATLGQLKLLHIPEDLIRLNIMPHGSHETGHMSCTANHIEVMKKARAKNQRRILVFEDDITLYKTADIERSIRMLKEFVQKNKFDILYLGCFAHKMEIGIHRYQIRKASCYATHGYLICTELMDMIKNLRPRDIVDHSNILLTKKKDHNLGKSALTIAEHPSIDIWLILLSDFNMIASYALYPTLLYQKSLPMTVGYKYTIEPIVSISGDLYKASILISLFVIVITMIIIVIVYAFKKRKSTKVPV